MPRVALLLLFSCFHALRGTSPRALELQHPAVPEPRGVLVGARKPAEDEAGGPGDRAGGPPPARGGEPVRPGDLHVPEVPRAVEEQDLVGEAAGPGVAQRGGRDLPPTTTTSSPTAKLAHTERGSRAPQAAAEPGGTPTFAAAPAAGSYSTSQARSAIR